MAEKKAKDIISGFNAIDNFRMDGMDGVKESTSKGNDQVLLCKNFTEQKKYQPTSSSIKQYIDKVADVRIIRKEFPFQC